MSKSRSEAAVYDNCGIDDEFTFLSFIVPVRVTHTKPSVDKRHLPGLLLVAFGHPDNELSGLPKLRATDLVISRMFHFFSAKSATIEKFIDGAGTG